MQQGRDKATGASVLGKLVLGICMVGLAAGATGCFHSNPAHIAAFRKPQEVDVTSLHYVLQPPDEVEIHCSRVPEIDKQRQRIRPDGKISFEALGEIEVAGKTPTQVAAILEGKVAGLYTLPGDRPIEVRVVAFQSQSYYVLGQVLMPGRKVYTGRDSVLAAVADARPNPMAWKDRIQVLRPSRDPNAAEPKIFEFNYGKAVVAGDLSHDVLLQEGDIVWVPPTVLAYVSLRIEEIITPITRAFSGAYYLSGGSMGVSPQGYWAD
ncbi:MAG: polysaccharide biosynthesis/export family protein [Phycisphaerae bacterium]|nr:polysaccharide biosynthesis/export family protein [Phycisphaerae bacterium]